MLGPKGKVKKGAGQVPGTLGAQRGRKMQAHRPPGWAETAHGGGNIKARQYAVWAFRKDISNVLWPLSNFAPLREI